MIRTWHHLLTDCDSLDAFLAEQQIEGSERLLIQLFAADGDDPQLAQLSRQLAERLPGAAIIGTTSYGWLTGAEHQRQGNLLSFCRFEHARLRVQARALTADHFATGQQLAAELCSDQTKLLLLFASPGHCNAEALLRGIASVAPQVVVAGGMASDQWTFDRCRVMAAGQWHDNAVVAAAIDSQQLSLLSEYSFGWRPLGRTMTVTRADGNLIHRLDDEPTRDVYARYLGQQATSQLLESSVDFPLMQAHQGITVARAPMAVLENGAIAFAGSFRVGDRVRFGYGDISQIGADATRSLGQLPLAKAEALFVYSCAGRCNYLKDNITTELAPLGATPAAVGFFSYGEFFHRDGHNHLLNHTLTCLLLAEECALAAQAGSDLEHNSAEDPSRQALFHLVQVTSDELTGLNQQLEQRVEDKTRQLINQIYTNALTGLHNRRQLLVDLDQQGDERPAHLALFDIDAFRQLNDVYGFAAGDRILQQVAQRCAERLHRWHQYHCLRLYKLPSDEYALTASSALDEASFLAVVQDLEIAIDEEQIDLVDGSCDVQVTFGVASGDASAEQDGRSLLSRADIALRQAREQHRELVVYSPELPMVRDLERNLVWLRRLRAALREQRIAAHFQPIYHAGNGQLAKFEALVRLIDEQGKAVSPYLFLDVAKKSRLYHHLTAAVVRESLALIRACRVGVSINLSLLDLKHGSTLELISQVIAEPEIGERLTFEIVESEGFEDYSLVSDFIQRVKGFGCSVVIDDFGSGYSSFAHFARLNVDGLKIDGSLIKTIDSDIRLRSVVHSIVDFARRLEIGTTAEFVHNAEVMALARDMGITHLQGFHLSPPVTFDQALALATTGKP